jgi:hypothetical protein
LQKHPFSINLPLIGDDEWMILEKSKQQPGWSLQLN